jgi:hypothetical protein
LRLIVEPSLKTERCKVLHSARAQCYKNAMLIYCGNLNPTFSRVKIRQYFTAIPR